MIERLKQAFALAEQRSEDEQQLLAEVLLKQLEQMHASQKWDTLLTDPRSDALLEQLVAEALAEDAAGETEEITGDDFLS